MTMYPTPQHSSDDYRQETNPMFERMPALDPATHAVRPWRGPTWHSTTGKLDAKPGTYCDQQQSHLLVSGICANCGLDVHGGSPET